MRGSVLNFIVYFACAALVKFHRGAFRSSRCLGVHASFLRTARPRCHRAAVVAQILRLIAPLSLGAVLLLPKRRPSFFARYPLASACRAAVRSFGARLLRGLNRGKIRRQILINSISHRRRAAARAALWYRLRPCLRRFQKSHRPKRLAFGRNTAPQTEKFAYRRLKGPVRAA